MSVAAEALEKAAHLLVHHRVMGHAIDEVDFLGGCRKLAVEEQIAGLQKIAVLRQILDRIAAIEENALVAVDVGDLGLTASRRRKAGVIGEDTGLGIKLADVHHLRADRAVVDRE